MKRIMIIGGNGAGKTTFAKILAQKLHLPLIHLDQLYWRDNWQVVPKDEFNRLHLAEAEKPQWVLDGNMIDTIPVRLTYADTVIYLDYSGWVCVLGVLGRILRNLGKSRPDMGGNCPERFDPRFLKTAWNFNKKNRKHFYDMLKDAKDVEIIILRNRRQADAFLHRL